LNDSVFHRAIRVIRARNNKLSFSSTSPSTIQLNQERPLFPHGLPHNQIVRHAMVSDPEEASISLPISLILMLTSGPTTPSSFPTSHLRGSFPSTLRLTACLLAVLRLKLYVAIQPPRTRYPVAGQPSGTGFPPARLRDLAQPHCRPDTYSFKSSRLPHTCFFSCQNHQKRITFTTYKN
jgi:hypothetical protein